MNLFLKSLLLSIALLLAACSGDDAASTTGNGALSNNIPFVYGLTLMPSGFDPHIHASAELGIPLRSVYDTLVYRDPTTGAFVPGLATRWETSPDGLTYTFYLREDVTFHDDTEFNAAAVAANLDRITATETGSQKAVFMLGPLNNYDIVDRYTIRLVLTEPYAPLLDSLSQVYLGIASPTQLTQYDTGTYQYHQVGTGPYRMVEYVPGDKFVITRNDDYTWGPSFYVSPANPIQTIEFRFFEDTATRTLALESGEAQVMGEIPPVDGQLLAGNAAIDLYPVAIPGQPLQFMINTQRFPTDNQAVRQALIHATNRAAIVDTIFRDFSPIAYGPLSTVTEFYNPEVQNLYPFDTEEAQSLLTAAGFTETTEDGILALPAFSPDSEGDDATPAVEDESLPGVPLRLILIAPSWGQAPEVAQLLQSQWRSQGIDLEIRQVPGFTQLREAAASGEYNLIAMNLFGRDPSQMNQFFMTDGTFNWTGYSGFDLDTYLREGARQPDSTMRQDMYWQAQRLTMEQALILPIRDYVNLNGASASIEGISFDAQGWFPLLHNFSYVAPGNSN